MSLHTIGIGHMCVTQSGTFRYAHTMEVGDDGTVGPSRLGYYKHQTAFPTTCATRASPAPAYDVHT